MQSASTPCGSFTGNPQNGQSGGFGSPSRRPLRVAWRRSVAISGTSDRRPFFSRRPSAEHSSAPQQLSRPTHSVQVDQGIWIWVLPDHRSETWPLVNPVPVGIGNGTARGTYHLVRMLHVVCRHSTSPANSYCGVAQRMACVVQSPEVCLGGGSSCWPPLCLSRSSPDAVTPPSPNLIYRPRRGVRSRSRACPSRFPPRAVA